MLIYLFKNTQLNKQRTILQIEDNLNEYLEHVDPNFSIQNKENWKKINGDKITFDSFKDSFNEYEEVDYAIVQFYPFNKNQYTYFFIKKVDFNSGGNYEITFEMDYISTFPLKNVILLDKKIRMQQGHLRQGANFSAEDVLRKNAFVRQLQPAESFENVNVKQLDKIINLEADDIKRNAGIDKWIVLSANKSILSTESQFEMEIFSTKTSSNEISESISQDYNLFFLPLTSDNIFINVETTDGVADIQEFNSQTFFDHFKSEVDIYWFSILDFPPLNTISWDEDNNCIKVKGENFIKNINGDVTKNLAISMGLNDGLSKQNLIIKYILRDNRIIFNYEKTDDIWDLNENNSWTEEQELILNFDPFKKFEIGFFTEASGTSEILNLNNQTYLNKRSNTFLYRKITPTNFTDLNFTNEYGDNYLNFDSTQNNYLFGDTVFQSNKNLFLSLTNEAWKNYNVSKGSRIMTDFGLPIAGVAAGVMTGSKIASAGFGLSLLSTINKRQSIKHTPDTFKNTAIELNTELLSGYDSKTLIIYEPLAEQKTRLANQFHKFGWYLFNNFFTIEKILLARSRFNFFQISVDENSDIFNKNLDVIYEDKYLQLLKNGITFWNFSKNYENFRKENIFKY